MSEGIPPDAPFAAPAPGRKLRRSPRRRASAIRRRSLRHRLGRGLLILLGFTVSGAIGAGTYLSPVIAAAFGDLGKTQSITGDPTHTPVASPTVSAHAGAASPTATPLTSQDLGSGKAFTMLLLGSDNDQKFQGDYLTQSMILCRVDPSVPRVVMLSIPRDLYAPLYNGYGYSLGTDKIDKAYSHGGAAAAIQTVEQDFSVHVDHYAWIGLGGLVKLIDRVGGVDVVVSNPVLDDFYPADLTSGNPYNFTRVAVLPGPQHLDGLNAMEYVRSRHGDLRGDFGRSTRQQQVLIALRQEARQLGVADLPDIAGIMGKEFQTDVSVTQVLSLMPLAGGLPLENVTQVTLLNGYTRGVMIGNQDVLMPDWWSILTLTHRYFPRSYS